MPGAAEWSDRPRVAAVVVTTERREGAARAARSVLESAGTDVELAIVRQGHGALPPELATLAEIDGVRVVTTPPRGLSNARNVGVRLTDAPIVAFTDDDCVAEKGWTEAIAAAFAADPRVGVVFGSVRAPSYDRAAGFIQAYQVTRAHTVSRLARQSQVCGIGACMAVRRAAFERLHGFDERLGAGTPVGSGEDLDIAMRSLLAGYSVHETPTAAVTHLGFRAWPEAPPAIEGYMRGLGATYAKMVRLGGVEAVVPVLALAWRWLARGPVVDLNHRPPRLDRLRAFLGGARWAWGMGLHSSTGWFADRPLAARLALDADRVSRVSTRAQPLPGAGD